MSFINDLLRAWGKLGYPRRAKRLHECATVIARDHDDVVPDDVDVLMTLPGVGSYTARAIGAFDSLEAIQELTVNDRGVRLKDIAEITYEEPPIAYGRHLDGRYAVAVTVFKESTANTVDVEAKSKS